MKQHASVLMLLARSTIYKMLAIFALMTAVECGVFFAVMGRVQGLEQMFDYKYMGWGFGGGLVLLTLLLVSTLSESGGKLDYTLRRLRVDGRSLFVWQSLYNTVCFFLFWAVQVFVALLLCRFWVSQQEAVSNQAVFLAFYRSEFLHSLLPLEDVSRYVRNIVLFASLGVCCACYPVIQRRGKQNFAAAAAAIVIAFTFPGEMGQFSRDMLWCGFGVLAVFISMIMTWGEEFNHED